MTWVIQLIKLVFEALAKGKGFLGPLSAISIVAVGGGYAGIEYVNLKHQKVIQKVRALEKMQDKTVIALNQLQNTLLRVADSVGDLKKTMEKIDERSWQIQRDVYHIKKNGR